MGKQIYLTILLVCLSISGFSQGERKYIREGNEIYKKGEYQNSEIVYRNALRKNPESFEAMFNLADALYKQERYDEAMDIYDRLVAKELDRNRLSYIHYNLGNCYLKQNKIEQSIEEYKNSLRLKFDKDAQYNLSYALLKLKNQNKQQQKKQNKVFEKLQKNEESIQRKMRGERLNMPREDKNW